MGYVEGYQDGVEDARREAQLTAAFNWPDRWEAMVDEVLDRLVRYYDRANSNVAEELRRVRKDYHHPSNAWASPRHLGPDEFWKGRPFA